MLIPPFQAKWKFISVDAGRWCAVGERRRSYWSGVLRIAGIPFSLKWNRSSNISEQTNGIARNKIYIFEKWLRLRLNAPNGKQNSKLIYNFTHMRCVDRARNALYIIWLKFRTLVGLVKCTILNLNVNSIAFENEKLWWKIKLHWFIKSGLCTD